MFNMTKIGIRIAALRRERDMTQIALADRLGVSHQAVSKWERGESMPDVSALPLLAEALGTTVDDLLSGGEKDGRAGKEAKILEEIIAHGDVKHMDEEITLDDLQEVAPLLKPSQINEAAGSVKRPSLAGLMVLAPFLDQDVLDDLAKEAAFDGCLETLAALAPFLGQQTLDGLAGRISGQCSLSELAGIAPFLGQEKLDELARKASDQGGVAEVAALGPFLSREALDDIAKKAASGGGLGELAALAPFLSSETLGELASDAVDGGDLAELSGLVPFLDKSALVKLLKRK